MDETKLIALKEGEQMRTPLTEAPPIIEKQEQSTPDETVKKKRRRGKSKRNIMKPFMKIPWQNRRKNDNCKRNNRFRKIVLAATHAPFNNNQFLMEIHKPEPENSLHILQTPGRNRDSSFSVDSEDNYLYTLPEDEEEYLTKEFSSVYEDVENEHLSNMTKNELVQEYLLLKSKYENLTKRNEVSKTKLQKDEDIETHDMLVLDKDSEVTDRDTTGTSLESSAMDETSFSEMLLRLKDQEDQIRELQVSNEKLKLENEHLRQRQQDSSSEDSESDSTSSSNSDSNSTSSASGINEPTQENEELSNVNNTLSNGHAESSEGIENPSCMVNGFHYPSE